MIQNVTPEAQWAICCAWLATGRTPRFADTDDVTVARILKRAGAPDPRKVSLYLRHLEQELPA